MSKGSKRRPEVNKRIARENWAIYEGGWMDCSVTTATDAAEFRVFFNRHDPDDGRLYWRPQEDAINDYANKAGAIE